MGKIGDIMRKCVVLLSGGIDSSVMLAMVKEQEIYDIYALSFDYGQKNKAELNAAIAQAIKFGVKDHQIITIDMGRIGGSSLTDPSIEVPKDRHERGFDWTIPSTYVPARNTVFLSFALGWAEVLGAGEIFIGANSLDFAGYPDCRPEYFKAFEKMANLSTRKGVEGDFSIRINTPLITMSKEEIVTMAIKLKVDVSKTISCYDPDSRGRACGHCDACKLRIDGFERAGADDPIEYVDAERDALLSADTTLLSGADTTLLGGPPKQQEPRPEPLKKTVNAKAAPNVTKIFREKRVEPAVTNRLNTNRTKNLSVPRTTFLEP